MSEWVLILALYISRGAIGSGSVHSQQIVFSSEAECKAALKMIQSGEAWTVRRDFNPSIGREGACFPRRKPHE